MWISFADTGTIATEGDIWKRRGEQDKRKEEEKKKKVEQKDGGTVVREGVAHFVHGKMRAW